MKHFVVISSVFIFSLFLPFSVAVSAQEEILVMLPKVDAGIKPDNILYPIDTWIEKIQVLVTRDSEKKARLLVEISQEKIAEIEEMKKNEDTEGIKKATERYIEVESKLGDIITDFIKSNPTGTEELAILISSSNTNGQKVLMRAYESLPNEAKTVAEEALKLTNRNIEDISDYTTQENKERVQKQFEQGIQESKDLINKELEKYLPKF